jgi:hypothetical protein
VAVYISAVPDGLQKNRIEEGNLCDSYALIEYVFSLHGFLLLFFHTKYVNITYLYFFFRKARHGQRHVHANCLNAKGNELCHIVRRMFAKLQKTHSVRGARYRVS